MIAEKRRIRAGAIDQLPKEKIEHRQLVVDLFNPNVRGFQRLLRSWEEAWTHITNLGHVTGGPVVQQEVPCRVKACSAEKEQYDFGGIDEKRHGGVYAV